jgi:ribosomal protein L37E
MFDCEFTRQESCGSGRVFVQCEHCQLRLCVPVKYADSVRATCSRDRGATPEQSTPDLTRHDAPSFLEKVKNFATAAAGHVAAGMPMATDDEIIRRHDICLQCEHLQNNACSLCGCPVARTRGYVSKLSWADQECPAGKWGKQVR